MTLTEYDVQFLQTLNVVSQHNRQSEAKKNLTTSKALLSTDLLNLFEVHTQAQGSWFFNVYVEFEPMFKEGEAKEWQR